MKTRPPDELIFFVDESLGSAVARALREAGAEIRFHHEHFRRDAPDAEWLATVGRNGWFVLTKDKSIRYRTLEREALIAANVGAFVLTSGNITGKEMCEVLVAALPKLIRFARKATTPFIAKVTRNSVVELYD